MTPEQYRQELNSHDWYYYFSDDYGVWRRGETESERLVNIAKNGSDELKRIYNEVHKRHFNTDSFVTPDRPYTVPFKLEN